MKITKVTQKDFSEWVKMGVSFWPNHTKSEIEKDFKKILASKKERGFICKNEDGLYLGFINISIRSDYVEGSKTNPAGYIETIYVKKEYRKKGIAKMLIKEALTWLIKKGRKEVGSDVEITNIISQRFHKSVGFKKGETLIHYIKKI